MFSIDKSLNKLLGKPKGASIPMQNKWKKMSPKKKAVARKRYKDSDRDGVPNKFDCQPFNPRKQDYKPTERDFTRLRRDIRNAVNKRTFVTKWQKYDMVISPKGNGININVRDKYGRVVDNIYLPQEGNTPAAKKEFRGNVEMWMTEYALPDTPENH